MSKSMYIHVNNEYKTVLKAQNTFIIRSLALSRQQQKHREQMMLTQLVEELPETCLLSLIGLEVNASSVKTTTRQKYYTEHTPTAAANGEKEFTLATTKLFMTLSVD